MKKLLLVSLGLLNALSIMQSYPADDQNYPAQSKWLKKREAELTKRISESRSERERIELRALLDDVKALIQAEKPTFVFLD
ncbi:MAG TPA: hypothetical protein VJJ83_01805 [Candidatus Babeliales bacterium]|nr:hypothetical protein [Candidatus Babeliales bacterium]